VTPPSYSILCAAYIGHVHVGEVKNSAPIMTEVPFGSNYMNVHEPVSANDDGSDYDDSLNAHVKVRSFDSSLKVKSQGSGLRQGLARRVPHQDVD
jgi:hypothetical protein